MPTDRSLLLLSLVLQGAIAVTFALAFLGLWRGFGRRASLRFAAAWFLYSAGTLLAALANTVGIAETAQPGVISLPMLFGVILFSAGTDVLASGDRAPGVRPYFLACVVVGVVVWVAGAITTSWPDGEARPFVAFLAPRLVMAAGYIRALWPLRRVPRARWHEGYLLLMVALALLAARALASAAFEAVQIVRGVPDLPESILLTVMQLVLLIGFGVTTAVVMIEAERDKSIRAGETIRTTTDALRTSEARFRFVVEHSADVLMLVGPDRRVRYVAPTCERLTGIPPSEIENRDLLDLVLAEDRERALRAFTRIVTEPPGHRQTLMFRIRHRSGEWLTFEVAGDLVRDPDGWSSTIILSARDVTVRRRLEQEVLQRRRLDSLGQMAGSIAHDFGNVLTGIQGGLEYAREHTPPESDAGRYLGVIDESAKRGMQLTRQLLSFARQAPQTVARFCVGDRVASLRDMIGMVAGRLVTVTLEGEAIPLQVQADPGQFDQVVINLVANARDAMPRGGRLTIRTGLAARSGGSGEVEPVTLARVTVEDTGCGIAEDVIGHVFEPFFTTKPEGQGNGLGLATAYGFAVQAGGALSVESKPGAGARFMLDLPLDAAPRRAGQRRKAPM